MQIGVVLDVNVRNQDSEQYLAWGRTVGGVRIMAPPARQADRVHVTAMRATDYSRTKFG